MNKQDLQARIIKITAEIESSKNQSLALVSHLNECNYWLSEALKAEKEQADAVVELAPQLEAVEAELIEL